MSIPKSTPGDNATAKERGGFFAGLGSTVGRLLYEQPEAPTSAAPVGGARPSMGISGPSPAPQAPSVLSPTAGPALDPQVVQEMRARLWDEVDDTGPAFKQFLVTLQSLAAVIPDQKQRIMAAISVLNGQGTNAVEIRLDLGRVRASLQQVIQQAEGAYSHAMQQLGQERGTIEAGFSSEQERLNARLTELSREVSEIQVKLGSIPQEQQAAVAGVVGRVAEMNRNHHHVQAASAAVVSELDAFVAHLG